MAGFYHWKLNPGHISSNCKRILMWVLATQLKTVHHCPQLSQHWGFENIELMEKWRLRKGHDFSKSHSVGSRASSRMNSFMKSNSFWMSSAAAVQEFATDSNPTQKKNSPDWNFSRSKTQSSTPWRPQQSRRVLHLQIYAQARMYTCTCTCIHTDTRLGSHTNLYTHIIHTTYTQILKYTHIFTPHTHVYIHTHTHIHTHIFIHTYGQTKQTYAHTYSYTYMCTHTYI